MASVRELLQSPNLTLANLSSRRGDLVRREIDGCLVALLQAIVRRYRITITSLKPDYSLCTASGSISNHARGRAADIGGVDGERCDGIRVGARGRLALELSRLPVGATPTELIYAFDADGIAPEAFADRPGTATICTWTLTGDLGASIAAAPARPTAGGAATDSTTS